MQYEEPEPHLGSFLSAFKVTAQHCHHLLQGRPRNRTEDWQPRLAGRDQDGVDEVQQIDPARRAARALQLPQDEPHAGRRRIGFGSLHSGSCRPAHAVSGARQLVEVVLHLQL